MIDQLKFTKARYLAFVLDKESRERLMKACPPEFEKIICHHITVGMGVSEGKFKKIQAFWKVDPVVEAHVNVVGDNVQAIVCTIDKDSQRFFHNAGGTYHVTMSLTPPAKPVESNQIIADATSKRTVIPFDDKGEAMKLTGHFEFVT